MIENQNKLTKFALKYTLRTRAILGAIFKEIGNKNCAYELKSTLNPMTNYKLKQSKCPNNPMKKIIQRNWIRCESWEKKSQPISFQNLYYCRLFKSKEI